MMKSKHLTLPVEDRQVIDLLLDPQAITQSSVMNTAQKSAERLEAAQKTLKLIGQLPAADPPIDLVARTLELIDSNPIPPPSLDDSQIMDSRTFNNPPT